MKHNQEEPQKVICTAAWNVLSDRESHLKCPKHEECIHGELHEHNGNCTKSSYCKVIGHKIYCITIEEARKLYIINTDVTKKPINHFEKNIRTTNAWK